MCLSYLSVLSLFLFSCKNVFFNGGGGGGGAGIQVGPTFFICSYFFLKMPYYPSIHSKMSFMRKNPEFFLARSALSEFNILANDFFQGAHCKTSFF